MGLSSDRSRNAVSSPLGEPIILKVGNRLPALVANLFDPTGKPASLPGTVTFRMREVFTRRSKITAGVVTLQDPATASVRYDWQAADTDTPAEYEGHFDHDQGGGIVESFPSNGAIRIRIEP
ncbi:hypothetical protein LCGC14_2265560 [marine sediment metagenome]|uniref:BppU N-terminal domain-containing protein n=1 Tax=marine sediment metagenome TaxID=412755 RepID=A0A0F9FAT5_9ZZZZ